MAAEGRTRRFTLAVLALVAALAAFQIVRTAAVADRQARPALATALWPAHPSVLTDRALLAIASAAGGSGQVPPETRADIRRLAVRAPLSPDPYLIEGAIAAAADRDQAVEPLLLAARARDPRSRGARFLLADRYLRTNRVAAGLVEMQSLIRLQPRSFRQFAPALAAYARAPGAVPELRAFFAKFPRAEAGVLASLARDPANADLVLALAGNLRNPEPDWRAVLVRSLVAAEEFARAHAIWARVSGVRPVRGLFNPQFALNDAPPPFDWHFPRTSEGIAEPDGKGGLSLLHYGRSNAVLASQLLLLRPGRYRLAALVEGTGGEKAARWRLRCARGSNPLAELFLARGAVSGHFAVPAGCDAQWLELEGLASESRATTDLTIRQLQLVPEARS